MKSPSSDALSDKRSDDEDENKDEKVQLDTDYWFLPCYSIKYMSVLSLALMWDVLWPFLGDGTSEATKQTGPSR